MSLRKLQDGCYVVERDGVYQNPTTKDRFQFRRGHRLPTAAANFKRVGPWPGEIDESEQEAKAMQRLENRAAPAPENKAAQKAEQKADEQQQQQQG